jgi:hypothetical protein
VEASNRVIPAFAENSESGSLRVAIAASIKVASVRGVMWLEPHGVPLTSILWLAPVGTCQSLCG